MAHAKHDTMRRDLRREVAGTIGLLADEEDFSAMRRYRTFHFSDHGTYLREVESLLRTLAAQGRHTTLALFDPDEYAQYCEETGLDPDTAKGRTHFTAQLAADGATVPYDGRALSDLVPGLIEEAARKATWDYAQSVLTTIGACADCGEDIGRAAFDRASRILARMLDALPPGTHHLVCSITHDTATLLAALLLEVTTKGAVELAETMALEFTTVLATGIATHSPGGVVLRTSTPGRPDRLSGWRLTAERLTPLTAAEVFDAYCTDVHTGEPLAPEPGADYCTPPDLGPDEGSHPHGNAH